MSVLLVSGGPSAASRTLRLLGHLAGRLDTQIGPPAPELLPPIDALLGEVPLRVAA
ncbi:hypothetical protein [Nonomuraea wenchangensis]|uniref:hypothetical protein n=1 Tax=Nonomuraea wenchangensis TaxID=568860 RepID=UPI003421E611